MSASDDASKNRRAKKLARWKHWRSRANTLLAADPELGPWKLAEIIAGEPEHAQGCKARAIFEALRT